MLSPSEMAERIRSVVKYRNTTVSELLMTCKLNRNAISSMTAGSYPKADNIAKIAAVLSVPIDYLMGSGVFEDWETILRNRFKVLENIASATKHISEELINGVDDITLAILVQAFQVKITERKDGMGMQLTHPIPTYPEEAKSFFGIDSQNQHLFKRNELTMALADLSDEEIQKLIEYAEFVKFKRK